MADSYKTIKSVSDGSYKDKGSKFLAFAFPVENEDDVNKHRSELRKKFFDARHHVYAFCLGPESANFRSSDDGEPSNSSGPPVLGQIRSFGLTNVLIVVVRYFGGTKLGVPGLINAYKTAAREALLNADIVEKHVTLSLILRFDYRILNDVMRILKHDGIRISEQNFESECFVKILVYKSLYKQMVGWLEKLPNLKIEK
jgi:uncharacterized YigZ family protein